MKPFYILVGALTFICNSLIAQFVEVSTQEELFVLQEGCLWGNGASFYDYNHDGWDDLTTADGSDFVRFYKNTGDGHFQVDNINLNFAFSGQIVGVLWLDIENDGDEDLLVSQNMGRLLLFVNDGNFNFSESAISAGLPSQFYFYYGLSAADYDNDGFIDFTIAKYYNPQTHPGIEFTSRLYRNNGDGTFSDVTITSGFLLPPRTCFIQVFLDYNNDGWQDIYCVIDRASWSNELFKNNGDGTFTNVTNTSGLGVFIDAMSSTMGDADRDGDIDIFVTNTYGGNKFFINNGDETFSEIAESSGLALFSICWGANWIDYDNNGWDDIFIPTAVGAQYTISQNHFFINNENNTFTLGNEETGIVGDIDPTFCNVIGDMNNDGYYDYYNNNNDPKPCRLWLNEGGENNYITVNLEGTISNRNAIGARINLYTSEFMQTKQVHAGESYIAQNSRKKIFGLGTLSIVDSLEIYWPSGIREVYYHPDINQINNYVEGESFLQTNFIVSNDSSLCTGQSITLDAGTALGWTWSTGETTRYIEVNSPGLYTCTKSFNFGFQSPEDSFTIFEQALPFADAEIQHPSCHEGNNGYIYLYTDYEEPLTISWSNGAMGELIGALTEGDYTYSLISESGCSSEETISIQAPPMIEVEAQTTDVLCFGENSGTLEIVNISGGVAPFDYQLNMPLDALSAGVHEVLIIDANNCTLNYTIEIVQPELLILAISTSPSVEDQPGSVNFEVVGGVEPYIILINNELITAPSPINMSSGNHTIEVIDANGCAISSAFSIEQIVQIEEQKLAIGFFPNPAQDQLFFSEMANVEIRNNLGQLLIRQQAIKKLNLSELSAGFYFVTINQEMPKLLLKN